MKINLLKEKSSDSLNVQILYSTKIELKKAEKGEIVGILYALERNSYTSYRNNERDVAL